MAVLRRVRHRAELVDAELAPVAADPHLAEEDRPGRVQPDRQRDRQQHRREHDQAAAGQQQVEQALGHVVRRPPGAQRASTPRSTAATRSASASVMREYSGRLKVDS